MLFSFSLFNHNEAGARSLHDVIGIIGHQLMALGHQVIWDPNHPLTFLRPESGINIIVEGFTPEVLRFVSEAHQQGCRFVIIGTEDPTDKGFNHGESPEMVLRQRNFPDGAKMCEAIFCLVSGKSATEWYSQFAPSAFVELGHAPGLVRTPDYGTPPYDFGFFGSLTKRRLKLLKKLAKSMPGHDKAVRVEATMPDQVTRDRVMREACVIVQIRKDDNMGQVSSSRCNTSLHLGRPVVAEPHELSHPWDQVVQFTPKGETDEKTVQNFLNACLFARSNWRSLHARQMEKFKTLMTPEWCVGRALREVNLDLNFRSSIAA